MKFLEIIELAKFWVLRALWQNLPGSVSNWFDVEWVIFKWNGLYFYWTVTLICNGIGCMCDNVNCLHLILWFWVFALSVDIFNSFIDILNACFKLWAGQPTKT